MAATYHRHVALTEPLSRFVEEEVAAGRYASVSEVVRDALRLLIERKDVSAALTGKDNQSHG